MRVLIACEFSGVVRNAFAGLGHEATSCDFLPTEAEFAGDGRTVGRASQQIPGAGKVGAMGSGRLKPYTSTATNYSQGTKT